MGHKVLSLDVAITVPDPSAVLANYDQIQVYRSTSGSGGPYVEITTAETRLALRTCETEYVYTDPVGSNAYWYKFAFFNSSTLAQSALSSAQPGELHPALDIMSIDELKEVYLFGIDLTDDAGNPMPDTLMAYYIINAVDWLEKKLDIPILPRVYEDERHDYYREDYNKYIWMNLLRSPVIGIEEVRLVLPGEQVVQVFERDWIHIQRHDGQLQLVPGTGTAGTILLGASGAWIPLIYGSNRFIPDAFRVRYEAGFGKPRSCDAVTVRDPDYDTVPRIIKELVGKIASFGPFNIAGDLIVGAGIATTSLSIDGLSQSVGTTSSATNSGYGARLVQYSKEIKDQIPSLRRYYKGISNMVVV